MELRKNDYHQIAIVTLVLISLIIPLVQFHVTLLGYFGVGGLFVNDTVGMASSLRGFIDGDEDTSYRTVIGVMMLYWPSIYFGFMYSLAINIMLLIGSAICFGKTCSKIGIKLEKDKRIALIAMVICNFYIMGCLMHPNKEIPLIFLTNLFIYFTLANPNRPISVALIIAAFLIRDGHGAILAISYGAFLFRQLISRHFYKFLIGVVILLSTFSVKDISSIGILGDFDYVLQRNVDIGDAVESILSEVPSAAVYSLKLFNNTFTSAFRPQLIDGLGRLYFIGIGLWQFGLILFAGIVFWCFTSLKNSPNDLNMSSISIYIIIALLIVSASAITQPRYMIPYIFWLSTGFVSLLNLRGSIIYTVFIFISVLLISALGYGAPIGFGIDIYPSDL